MKLKCFALSMACVMAVALTGCSANRETNSAAPNDGVFSDDNDHASAGVGDNAQNSSDVGDVRNSANVNNDAAQGGGAGGTNDHDNDGMPDSGHDNVMDDIGDAAGDLAHGAGDAARDAGNAIGDAANGVGNAVR